MAQAELSNKKLLQGAKQEKQKQDTRLQQMKHELRKLQIDNDKLRQSLRQKLDLKGVATPLKQVMS